MHIVRIKCNTLRLYVRFIHQNKKEIARQVDQMLTKGVDIYDNVPGRKWRHTPRSLIRLRLCLRKLWSSLTILADAGKQGGAERQRIIYKVRRHKQLYAMLSSQTVPRKVST
jgi:hypothetical protein